LKTGIQFTSARIVFLRTAFLGIVIFVALTLGAGMSACQSEHRPAAPLGERTALEQLASAYETVSEQLPVSPSGLTPSGKLKFVQAVFVQAGYDLNATLQALAQTPPEALTAYHRDMMELVLLPSQGLSEPDTAALHGDAQLSSIKRIKALYNR
jgi:hypothetical protein